MKEARIRKPEGQQRLFGLSTPLRSAVIPPLSAARWLLVLIVAAGVYFFHGFLVPVLAALVIAFASWPLYRRLLAGVGGNRTIAATLAILFILTFLVVPIAFAGAYATNEVREWVGWAIETNREGAVTPHWIATLPVVGEWLNEQWTRNLGHPGGIGELIQLISGANIGSIYRGVLAAGGSAFGLLLALLFMMIALFFAYRDGEHFAGQIDRLGERILPTRWERISRVVPATISSTVTGMTIIAIGEGVVLGVAYWLAGVPSPVTLGALTGIMALIPGGAPLSFTLVSIYLAASGSPMAGLALFIWGSVELFIVDKTLRPKLVGGPIKLPFLPTFFGLIGGVKTMGFLGLFIGPVLMALLVAIWREWLREVELADELAPAAPDDLEGAPPQIDIVAEHAAARKSQAG
ncbi:AI-2E family transporter [Mesorhizobium mediterraneum]|uniref:AI-2E family transporter n=1 Tax=Mesorhizobium mediterraneum TaxID=43617 RepID=A0AB36R9B9_9HYPH|nr:AI-2E family transporter [Mesorhizobium mediterraneum]PAQ01065.1 AI-2E family transporter [Mesorhizobium mediterraneum]RWN41101.1 MAG: AI-2E family transporter [Mesorhizobium sp.]WIW52150.1 AI-2E family transporter [Mesorhizobium mediterraneum]